MMKRPVNPFAKGPLTCALGLALCAPVAAQTACPTAADLEGGIELIRSEPFYSNLMTATEGGLAEARIMVRDGPPEAVSSVYAHGLAVTQRVAATGTLNLVYAEDPAVLDELPRIGSWASGVELLANGAVQDTGTATVRFVAVVPLELGACTYDTWQTRTSLSLQGRQTVLQDLYYAPDLGIVLASVSLDAAGTPTSAVIYDQIKAR